MKRFIALTALALLMCACTRSMAVVSLLSDAQEMPQSSQAASGVVSNQVEDADMVVMTEDRALEILGDQSKLETYSQQPNCVISHRDRWSKNTQPLTEWIRCYREGLPAQVEILYDGWTMPCIYVLECDGSEQYTITEYSDALGKNVYTSSMLTERAVDYTFGADITGKNWPIPIKKKGLADEKPSEDRYDQTVVFKDDVAHVTKEELKVYLYNSDTKKYTIQGADISWSGYKQNYSAEIENNFGRPLFALFGLDKQRGIIYLNITQTLNTRNFTKKTEREILYSLARTMMENEPDYIGVCFETEVGGEIVPYDGGMYFGSNAICMPPEASPLGALSIDDATQRVKEHISTWLSTNDTDIKVPTANDIEANLYAAKYIDGMLFYLFRYYENGADLGGFAMDVDTGNVFYSISAVDGAFVLVWDEGQKRILPNALR